MIEVLAGMPVSHAAAAAGIEPAALADAVDLYQSAGLAALEAQARATRDWYPVRVEFTDWTTAESVATQHLRPAFQEARNANVISRWWFVRKRPCWRIRFAPNPGTTPQELRNSIGAVLNGLVTSGHLIRWWKADYEPEEYIFGGPDAIDIAHELHCADTLGVLDYLNRQNAPLGRREMHILLCSAMCRSANLEWHELGDVWRQVAAMRPLPPDVNPTRLQEMQADLRRLMAVDLNPNGNVFSGGASLSIAAPWTAAYMSAGKQLGEAAHAGTLTRGLRNILAHHVIFAANRLGLSARTQAILAHATRDTVMNPAETATEGDAGVARAR
ncbi:thiopeptide-type bacteriocin biosynthesis protein [Polymorphospora sp. NPDC051019]|uniref:thiopeptide-type bacteriocin biosynthesis protein n=1 Tax=Polymorphospora sp. NPDC051019 TaxID=3155725 RepID=UPI003442B64F